MEDQAAPPLITGQFNDSFVPIIDGVAFVMQNYCYWLNRKLGPCYAITPSFPGYVDSFDFPVLRYLSIPLPKRPPYRAGLPEVDVAFRNQIRDVHFDLVHAHCPFSSGQLALRIARGRDIPIVATLHTKYRDNIRTLADNEWLERFILRRIIDFYESVDQVWVPNRATRETLHEYGYRGECEIVANGTDIVITPAEREQYRRRADAELGTLPTDTVLLYVGQHVWEKNHLLLINALKHVRDAGRAFRMFFVGGGYATNDMKELVEQFGLSDRVRFLGVVRERERIKSYYSRADLMLFPSLYDTESLTIREAAACRLPAVLISGSATAEGIRDGENGFLAANSADAYAEKIVQLVDNPQLRCEAGEGAFRSLYRPWEQVANEVQGRYREIVKAYRKVPAA